MMMMMMMIMIMIMIMIIIVIIITTTTIIIIIIITPTLCHLWFQALFDVPLSLFVWHVSESVAFRLSGVDS